MELTHKALTEEEASVLAEDIALNRARWNYLHRGKLNALHELVVKPSLRPEPSDRILEIGVGDGYHLGSYTAVDYKGVDVCSGAVMRARMNAVFYGLHRDQIIQSPANQIPFESGQINKVFSVCVLHETNNAPLLLDEIDRVLASKGTVVFVERMTAYCESPIHQARLEDEPKSLPVWFRERGYRTRADSFRATYNGELVNGKPLFDFYILTADKA